MIRVILPYAPDIPIECPDVDAAVELIRAAEREITTRKIQARMHINVSFVQAYTENEGRLGFGFVGIGQ